MIDEREGLRDEAFIRHRLYGGSGSPWQRYGALVLARPSFWTLIRYELLTTFLGPVPGVLGMVLRKLFYPFLFPRIGRGVVFGARVTIRHPERVYFGDGVVLDDDVLIDGRGAGDAGLVVGDRVIVNRGACVQAKVGAISIGAGTNVGSGVRIISQGPIHIAEDVSIAGGCVIAGGRYVVERKALSGGKERFTGGEIRIGKETRLGMNAMVQDGVTVGEGAIVAPASVVMTDVAANTVVSGFPARPWRERKVKGDPAAGNGRMPAASVANAVPDTPVADGELAKRIRDWLEETRFAEFGGVDGLSDEDSLFDADILDSLSLVSLVAWLEQTFDMQVADEDLVPENLETVVRIAEFVRRRAAASSP